MKPSKLQRIARAQRNPAIALVLESDRIEAELSRKMKDIVLSDPKFMSTLLQNVISEIHSIKVGNDGYTPKKGKDYFTENELGQIVKYIESRIKIPKDGTDADEEKVVQKVLKGIKQPDNGVTPVKDIDYLSAEATQKLIYTEIATLFALKPKEGNKGITKSEVDQLIGKIQTKIDFSKQATEIARGLESIKTEKEKLDYNALKNTPDIPNENTINRKVHSAMRGGGDRVRVYELTGTGATKVFTVPAHKRALLLISTDFPILFKSTTDFTTSGTTLTINSSLADPSSGASLAFLYVE